MAGRLSKVGISPEFPDYYKSLSRRLYKVLEDIGASTVVRAVMMKTMKTNEILLSIYNSSRKKEICARLNLSAASDTPQFCPYIFGSSFEGATTPGLTSDIDYVFVDENLPVVRNISEAQQYQDCLLLVQDSYTPAGYAKLQHVYMYNGVPLIRCMLSNDNIDAEDRSIFTNIRTALPGGVLHGPASTREASYFTMALDLVPAVRSRTWPDCASEWLTRQRNHNWPTQDQIDKCKTLGCFFVPVGHPNSSESHLQQRMSFSLQERLLVTNFNSVQLKCYILLKMIKKEIIHKTLSDKTVSSYHCKTCMLYLIENSPAEFWTEDNLLFCLHNSLKMLLNCVETGVCPNYFIPGENMFEGRIFGQLQVKLRLVLRKLLSANFKFLLLIKSDMLGNRYQEALFSGLLTSRYPPDGDLICDIYMYHILQDIFNFRELFLLQYQNECIQLIAKKLYELKLSLQRTDRVTEHTVEETREAMSLFVPYIDVSLMSMLIVLAKRLSKSNDFIFNLLASDKWHAISLKSDPFSSKLKQSSLMYMLGYCEMSLDNLIVLQDRAGHHLSLCGCSRNISGLYSSLLCAALSNFSVSSYEELLHRHMIPCVVFLPAERDLAPSALCYEMNRSVGSPPEHKKRWYDWAVIDGKILLYFLLYLNHHHLGMEAHAAADADNIRRLINTDILLRHRETAFNLLGWIYKEKGLADKAMECFQESLAVQPIHNAALWQLACMICAKINNRKNRCS